MDKQIINGVNVSECDNHYIENNKHICKYNFDECNPKKEQCPLYVTRIEEQLKHKEQECEELKEDRERWESNFNGKVSAIEELLQQLDQLKQILAKIKEICNNNDELQGDFNLVDCDKYKLGKHNLANKILQKISESEVKK